MIIIKKAINNDRLFYYDIIFSILFSRALYLF